MGAMGDARGYLELSPDPVRFEPVSKVTNVFFDDTSKEVSGLWRWVGSGRGWVQAGGVSVGLVMMMMMVVVAGVR
ncbi:hypothetical protein E2C01_038760 [Portunus trituberculatus]|uniref:Uncharacterized protein n=1 Tax=Portunus trituberculatus TaxID=210409 RepID=A0A5B7FHM1_PORTR|nr:hypothetical protein [Portunus trituberculatus]